MEARPHVSVPEPAGEGSGLAGRIAHLSPERRAALAAQLRRRRAQGASGIRPRDSGADVPLSHEQRRLWFLEQWSPGTHAYNATFPLRLTGKLDVGALAGALNRIVERHETLRTTVEDGDGEPRSVTRPHTPIDVPLVDISDLSPATRALAAERIVAHELRRRFDLASDALLRATLVRLACEEHLLVLVSHHIVCDGWSKNLLFDELSVLYSSAVREEPAVLPDLPVQYADYACWQNRRLAGPLLADLEAYWRDRLATAPPVLDLLTDLPRPRSQAFRGAVEPISLSRPTTERVRALGLEESATLYMTALAAFGVLLWARTGQDDVVIGSPIAGRDHAELEHLIGCFVNTLPMRVQLSADEPFRALVRAVRAGAIGAYAHRELPFEQIVNAVAPPRDPRRNPICQVNFRVEPRDRVPVLAGLDVTPLPADPGFARFDFAIELQEEAGGGLGGYVEYDTALCTAQTAAELARDYERLVDALLREPDTRLRDVADALGLGSAASITRHTKEHHHAA